jgi:6-pyruvoyl-tetrahydropterin synthase
MYTVSVSTSFDATHSLRMRGGQFEPVHRHHWMVRGCFAGPDLDRQGLLVDFVLARAKLEEITSPLAGSHLNEWSALGGENPSAERVAETVFHLLAAMPDLAPTVHSVTVTEAPGCEASYLGKDASRAQRNQAG